MAVNSLPQPSRLASLAHISDVSGWVSPQAQSSTMWADALQASPVPRVLRRVPETSVLRNRRAHSRRFGRGLIGSVDAYFRRQDTWLARGLSRLFATSGAAYTDSAAKRALDLAVSVPLVVIVILLIALLVLVNKLLYPRRPALFLQDRVGRGDRGLRIVKIRSMVPGSKPDTASEAPAGCTAFGRFIRRHYLDELPQLLQVLTGQLSLVGVRVLPRDVYQGLAGSWSPKRFETWRAMYATAPLGLTGAHQVFRGTGKHDGRRFHRDMFYARHATLGFDLYLLWRTLGTTDSEHRHAHT